MVRLRIKVARWILEQIFPETADALKIWIEDANGKISQKIVDREWALHADLAAWRVWWSSLTTPTGPTDPEFPKQDGHDAPVEPQATAVIKTEAAEPPSPPTESTIDAGVRLVALVASVGELQERALEESEWRDAYKRHLKSLRIGDSLMVVPSWDEPTDVGSRQVIRLDPGLAFGTGHHPTTRMCLKFVEEFVRPGASVLDVGCGSGILSIAAAKLGAGSVLGFDVEADAVMAAGRNIEENKVEEVATVIEGTFQTGAGAGHYDLVLANISANVIIGSAKHFAPAAKPAGAIVFSGVLEERGDEVVDALITAGLVVSEVRQEGDWLAILAVRS